VSIDLFIHSRAADHIVIALVQDGKLMEYNTEIGDNHFCVGDIYHGKVKRLVNGLNAAFVDVGYEKDAFLHYHDLGPQFQSLNKFLRKTLIGKQLWSLSDFEREPDINKDGKIEEVVKTNKNILVQIAKEPISTKGPRITTEISLAGRFLVLVPFSDRISVSQKISEREERNRLKDEVREIRPQGFGVIIRTVAEGKSKAELEADLNYLIQRWKQIHRQVVRIKPPGRVLRELNTVSSMLRDMLNDSFNSIVVDDEELFTSIQNYLHEVEPDRERMVKHYKSRIPMLEHYGIERQIKTSFGRSVAVGKGAYLIIEHTEAMHVIDVNSGNRSNNNEDQEANALSVNMLAAEEIARQLRLRDMGGIIVVDFIDMHRAENRRTLFEKLKEEMAKDRAKHKILPPSKFGLVEITRQRVKPEMNINTMEENPEGNGEIEAPILILNHIEMQLESVAKQYQKKEIFLHTHPFVAAYISQGLFSNLRRRWSKKYKIKLKVMPRDSFKFLEYHFFDKLQNEIK
jgi:ribonuclease G